MADFEGFLGTIQRRMMGPLPGREFHDRMSPSHREMVDPERALEREHRKGAVMVLLYPLEGEVATVYTARRADLTHHAGQISFPGGRLDEGESASDAAIREAEEEIGLDPKSIQVLGPLTPLYIPPSRFIVHPFLAVSHERPGFRMQEREVERILEIPLAKLLDPANRRVEVWDIRGEKSHVPSYDVGDVRIWGATAMITSELLGLVDPQTYTG